MEIVEAKLSRRNQMVLPKRVREALGVQAGDVVLMVIDGESVYLLPRPADYVEFMHGLGKEVWSQLGGGEAFHREEMISWE
ncbi:MAG: AbrB/MazE/SpoVT family DNA-binding domain-containing protein [Chloroflexota bacterium]|nr:AbrB/MazE/SpoVT family DNA-binding domain-containing protein [Chloroflexota bacterium]